MCSYVFIICFHIFLEEQFKFLPRRFRTKRIHVGERLNVRRAVLASSVGSVHDPRGYRYLNLEL